MIEGRTPRPVARKKLTGLFQFYEFLSQHRDEEEREPCHYIFRM
jgi:hypothetical protein